MKQSEKNKLEFEGKIFSSNNYGDFKVLKYNSTNDVDIEFLSTGTKLKAALGNIKKGCVKDPYYPNIYGVGYIGEGQYTSRVDGVQLIPYKRWKEILNRCYNSSNSEYNSYGGNEVKVCDEWLNFQNFAKWWEETCPNDTFTIDKDILVKGNKLYCPERCCFVPIEINSLFTTRKSQRGEYPLGVRLKDGKFIAQINYMGKKLHLGTFDSPKDAFNAYKKSKEKCIKEYADRYKGQISEDVYNALYNYKIEITD